MNFHRILCAGLTALFLFLAGCDRSSDTTGAPAANGQWDPAVADRARLVEVLPAHTWAYLRIPNLWGLATAPKSGSLAPALGTAANREAVSALQARIPGVMAAEFGAAAPLMTLLLETLRSPLEIAVVGERSQPGEADLVIEGRFDFESIAELNATLGELAGGSQMIQIVSEAAADAPGQIVAGMFPVFFGFDAETRRVRLVGGMAAQQENFAATRDWVARDRPPMHAFEQQIDASRQGLFVWADMDRFGPVLESSMPPEQVDTLRELGAFATDELALGYGAGGGKARLALLARGSGGTVWDLALPGGAEFGWQASGPPVAAAGLTLPDYAWLEKAWSSLSEDSDDSLKEVDTKLRETGGIGLESLMNTLAGRLYYVDDDNGGYLVHEGAGAEAWGALWDGLATKFDIRHKTLEVDGGELRHVVIPGVSIDAENFESETTGEQAVSFLIRKFMNIGTHLYYMAEDDHVVIAAVPQVLQDRLAYPGDVSLETWLHEAGVDVDSAAAFAAMEVGAAPRRNYYAYIGSLLALGDILDHDLDVSDFPTARELDLPDKGTIGVRIDYAGDTLGAVITFENHPGDLLYAGAGGMGAIAVVGILAAVAIPAYQDYTVRAKTGEAVLAARQAQAELAAFVAEHGRLPDDEESAAFDFEIEEKGISEVFFHASEGAIIILFDAASGLGEDAELLLYPEISEDMIVSWRCESDTLDDNQLPAMCR